MVHASMVLPELPLLLPFLNKPSSCFVKADTSRTGKIARTLYTLLIAVQSLFMQASDIREKELGIVLNNRYKVMYDHIFVFYDIIKQYHNMISYDGHMCDIIRVISYIKYDNISDIKCEHTVNRQDAGSPLHEIDMYFNAYSFKLYIINCFISMPRFGKSKTIIVECLQSWTLSQHRSVHDAEIYTAVLA
jgi:hypothetical protein